MTDPFDPETDNEDKRPRADRRTRQAFALIAGTTLLFAALAFVI